MSRSSNQAVAKWAGFTLLLLSFCASFGSAAERVPVPFTDAYHDGFALLMWRETTPSELHLQLRRIAQTGAKQILIPYFGCQSTIHSADVGSCEVAFRTGPQAQAKLAIAEGFEVSFLPIVVTPNWEWRGFFDPADVNAWFRSYTAWIKRVAGEARALGMKELIVASEITKLYAYENQWKSLIAEVRQVFPGPLILTVNWGDLQHGFWSDVDAIGVSAYYPLSQEANPTQAQLDVAWKDLHEEFVALSRHWNRPIHITEFGYPSVTSAARMPWSNDSGNASDFALQARCFEAFRKAWANDRLLVRANIWGSEVGGPSAEKFSFSFEPLYKPAEEVLRSFFSLRQR